MHRSLGCTALLLGTDQTQLALRTDTDGIEEADTDLDVLDDIGRLANVLVRLVVIDHGDERLARRVHVT